MDQESSRRLFASSALIAGLNPAGLVCANYLVRAGLGKIGLLDNGGIEASDILSSIAFGPKDIGQKKAATANQYLSGLNRNSSVVTHLSAFDAHMGHEIFASYDLVIDGLSDWQGKLLASDLCMQLGKPLIHQGLFGFRLHTFACVPGKSACLRCVLAQIGMEDFPATGSAEDVFGPASGIAGSLQASEAIKFICSLGLGQYNSLVAFDILKGEFSLVPGLARRPDCPDCGRPNLDS